MSEYAQRVEAALDAVNDGDITLEEAGQLLARTNPADNRRAAARLNTVKVTEDRLLQLVGAPGPLIDGRLLTCPGCESSQDILAYTPLNHSHRYEEQVVVPLVCPACKHCFALRP